jgi:hypothetical protein
MICCGSGSGSDFGKVSGSGSGSGSRQYLAVSKNKKLPKSCISMSAAAYFPESWPLIFDFCTFLLHFMLDPDPNQEPKP